MKWNILLASRHRHGMGVDVAVCGAAGAYAENIDQKEGVWLQQSAARCNSHVAQSM